MDEKPIDFLDIVLLFELIGNKKNRKNGEDQEEGWAFFRGSKEVIQEIKFVKGPMAFTARKNSQGREQLIKKADGCFIHL